MDLLIVFSSKQCFEVLELVVKWTDVSKVKDSVKSKSATLIVVIDTDVLILKDADLRIGG